MAVIHQKFNKAGFDIFSISLDTDKGVWLRAAKKDGIEWTNTIAKNGFKDPVIKMLQVQYLPSNYLLDQEGKILAINIKPDNLKIKLVELLE